jgi:hypothetical protein
MYCIIQFYIQLRVDLAEHKPFLKVLAIKLVIFLCFWQTLIISFLSASGVMKPSAAIAEPDLVIGIPSAILCIEMAIFSIFHLWAYPWGDYDIRRSRVQVVEGGAAFDPNPKTAYKGGFLGVWAYLDAWNPWDLIKAIARGFRWFFVGRKNRTQDSSYANLDGTPLANAGAKPGRTYEPLHDNDMDISTTYNEPYKSSLEHHAEHHGVIDNTFEHDALHTPGHEDIYDRRTLGYGHTQPTAYGQQTDTRYEPQRPTAYGSHWAPEVQAPYDPQQR